MTFDKNYVRNPDLLVPWIQLPNGLWKMVEVNKNEKTYGKQESQIHWKKNDLFEDMFQYSEIVGFNNRSYGVVFKSCSTEALYYIQRHNFDKIMKTYSFVMGTLSGYWYFTRSGAAWYLCYQGPN